MLWNQPNFRRNSVLALLLASLLCANVVAPAFAQSVSQPPEPTTAVVELPIEEEELFNLFQEIKDTILLLYPKLVDVETLYQGAIRGLFESLDDPYSEYLDKEEFESLSQDMEGEFSGIGVAIQLISSNITVVSVFKGSPAQKAGMQPGDVIIKVDGTDLRGKKLQDASALLRGEPGTRVTVTVLRPRTGESLIL
ncbi:MAG TPA: PDZ domain-containing protein, partial [Firmicutes bacterium]|nr:PDZ domain-containing protein [Candidatus Fermentithermobacillaceae bacterium]